MASEETRNRNLLFPEWLDKGSKGAAVVALQVLLGTMQVVVCDHGTVPVTGEYDERTASEVKTLQQAMDLIGDDVDGNFGKLTRRKLKEIYSIDVDCMARSPEMTTEAKFPDGSTVNW